MAPIPSKRLRDDDFILTLSDPEGELSEEDVEGPPKKKQKSVPNGQHQKSKLQDIQDDRPDGETNWTEHGEDDGALDSDFEFQVGETSGIVEDFDGWEGNGEKAAAESGRKRGVDIDDIIKRRREKSKDKATKASANGEAKEDMDMDDSGDFGNCEDVDSSEEEDETLAANGFGMGAVDALEDEEESELDDQPEDAVEAEDSDVESTASPVAHPDDFTAGVSEEEYEEDDQEELNRRAAFFAPEENIDGPKSSQFKAGSSFQAMQLSRPILKSLASIGFTEPTPIQLKTIPVALLGKDVVGGAVTGSGKTAAFIIPILERLLYRPKKVPTTRVAILMPTRELAVQCFNVAKKLASFTDITFVQIVGGFSLREQEKILKTRPDVAIATPGRFIDHMRNSPSFAVDTLEILVLDEADRMLEDGFADELNEILTTIPKSRQTMLFSATMTDRVDKLIRLGLNRPVRLFVDAKKQTVSGLVQEFIRLRPGKEDRRLAYLMHLCEKIYTERVIIFFRQKKEAHRVRVIFSICGFKAAELHGSMTQEQRIAAVESFRSGSVSFLLATDLASRGLDIKNVSTVLNYEAPQTHEIYLHRVGRTARAGRSGCACTLAAEPDRKVVKAAVKAARAQGAKVVSRAVDAADIEAWHARLQGLEQELEEVLKEEREERALQVVERDITKGENIIKHEDEIMARPRRTWFETEKQKKAAKMAGFRELNPDADGKAGGKKQKKKLSNKDRKKLLIKDERKDGHAWKKGKAERGIKDPAKLVRKKGKSSPKKTVKAGKGTWKGKK